jgi:hypothetical protein
MKNIKFSLMAMAATGMLALSSCTTVNLTSWKDPGSNAQINKLVVMALFDKLEYAKPFEETTASYWTTKGLKCVKSLDFMAPGQQFTSEELKEKVAQQGADAIVIFTPKSADKSVNYTPPTYTGYYRGWYGGLYSVSPGYYSESTTYHVQANLYTISDDKLIWTGDLSTTDPGSIEMAASKMAQGIYNDWIKNKIVSSPGTGK